MNEKSNTAISIGKPPIVQGPLITDDVLPVLALASSRRFLYDFLSENFNGSTGAKVSSISTNEPSSTIEAIRFSAEIRK